MKLRLVTIAAVALALGCAARLAPDVLADLTQRAEAGDARLQIELGDRYRDGRGVERDSSAAARWYRMAAAHGASGAMSRLVCLGRGHFEHEDLLGADGVFPSTLPKASADGLVLPSIVRRVDPRYTRAAMRARITGEVEIDAVVLANGAIGELQITKSLDPDHGLDEQALCAALQWQFRPGTLQGRPVAMVVELEFSFNLR